ncbi:MAG: glycerol-3-phosphate acyltransferase [Ilumatobacteraceae bacterium]
MGSRPGSYALIAAAVIGHMFPATRRFRGGKGAATFGGSVLVMFPLLGVGLLAAWIVIRKLTGKASLATLAIIAGLLIGVAVRGTPAWEMAALVAIAAVVLLRHADNIRRLLGGRELSATGQ